MQGVNALRSELKKRGVYMKMDSGDICHVVAALRCRRRVVLVEEERLLKVSDKLEHDFPSVRNFRISFDLVPHGILEDASSILRLVDEGHAALESRDCLP